MDYGRMSDRRLLEAIVETPGSDDSGQSDSNDDPLSCSDSENDGGNGQEGEFNENDTGSFPSKEGPRWFTRKLDNQLYQRGFLSILRNVASNCAELDYTTSDIALTSPCTWIVRRDSDRPVDPSEQGNHTPCLPKAANLGRASSASRRLRRPRSMRTS